MEEKNRHFIKFVSISAFLAAIFVFIHTSRAENSNSTIIENNVSSSANSSGNSVSGPGEVETGNANTESNVSTKIKGGGKVEVDIKAEANGKKAEANVKEENPKENINISKIVQDENNQAKVEVNIETGKNNPVDASQGSAAETQAAAEVQSNKRENNSFFIAIFESVSGAVKNIFNKITSFFT